ncbi:MAG: NAD(P)-dependent oxidoreductase [Candidatus Dormibacteria bacterium]
MTGAAGRVAGALREGVASRVRRLVLLDLEAPAVLHEGEVAASADLRDQSRMIAALDGVDGVIHLGGIADEAAFGDLAEVNIVGTFHMYEAARVNHVKRVVNASSNRATGFYSTATRVEPDMPVRPDGLYGVSKAATEALGRLYVDKFGLEVVNIRIGSLQEAPRDQRHLSTWLSHADCLAAFLAAMTAPEVGYSTFYGVSNNRRAWWDLAPGRALGYHPTDDAERFANTVSNQPPLDPGAPQGGEFASVAYTLDRQRRQR